MFLICLFLENDLKLIESKRLAFAVTNSEFNTYYNLYLMKWLLLLQNDFQIRQNKSQYLQQQLKKRGNCLIKPRKHFNKELKE